MLGFMPAGVEPDSVRFVERAAEKFRLWYGFQKFPPVTSAISMLYEANRASTVPIRGIIAGLTVNTCARTGGGTTDARTRTTATMAQWNSTQRYLLSIRHLCATRAPKSEAESIAQKIDDH